MEATLAASDLMNEWQPELMKAKCERTICKMSIWKDVIMVRNFERLEY